MSNYEDLKQKEKIDPTSHQEKYQEETFGRFGNTNAYKESHFRTSKYSKEELNRIVEKGNDILRRISELMDKDPSDPEVQILIQEWRDHITNSFYNCTIEILKGLGRGYVLDERFRNNIDLTKPGLAQFLSEAIEIYCQNNS